MHLSIKPVLSNQKRDHVSGPKELQPVIMKVLDELSEKYFIHKRPTIKKSDNLEHGWGVRWSEDDGELHVHHGTTHQDGDRT